MVDLFGLFWPHRAVASSRIRPLETERGDVATSNEMASKLHEKAPP
jgi:hypothetical protein